MSETAEKTDPDLWEKVKDEITAGAKGGKKGQWSARKAQMAVAEYKKRGGGYAGGKDADNSLHQWSQEDWGTKSGKKSGDTGERYLPKEARAALSNDEYRRTSAKKRADTRKGKQFSAQPEDVAEKTRPYRDHRSKADLYAEAKKRDIPGRSTMSKDELAKALAG
ncbi:hypothetical protein ACMGDM_13995 [Sphingomonas sp. DT-51]|uniref:hypothetical protein n=1 Tax=Sphingomonas sp. DT-51 TaxID=3396165 RepID=UPI003F1A9AE2